MGDTKEYASKREVVYTFKSIYFWVFTMWKSNDVIDGTYLIMHELGRGGTGVIYLAYHLRLEKYVVLKRIKENFTDILKVRTEVDILKKLHHTYLPQVYDFMQVGNQIYTVIDYIDGCDLDTYIKGGYACTEEMIVKWLYQLCNVLDYLHSQRPMILHCDIKPGNIMIDSQTGDVCLIDFNVSLDKGSESELTGISQYYASPEQYEKAMDILSHRRSTVTIDQRTDIYSLGATLYHLMSGVFPSATTANVPLSQMILGYSPELLKIIDRMMDSDPKRRYRSTKEVVSALNRMYKKNGAVRRFVTGLIVSATLYGLCIVGGIWMITLGTELKVTESFSREYASFTEVYDAGDLDGAITKGIDLLNRSDYHNYYKKNSGDKAEILHCIGECYFYNEEYDEAVAFYKDAVMVGRGSSRQALYYRDHAIALIRANRISEAENVISNAKAHGLRNDDLKLIDAELMYMNKRYSESTEAAYGLAKHSLDTDIVKRAYLLASDGYMNLDDFDRQIECLEGVVQKDASIINQRRLGDAFIKEGESLSIRDVSGHKRCYESARVYYEKIVENPFCTMADKLNLAVVYMELSDYTKAIDILGDVNKENDGNYRVPMLLAFCYDMIHDYENARDSCLAAVRLYDKTSSNDKESATSDNIQSLYSLEQKLR